MEVKNMLTAVTGINWGDEGKGRVIDLLAEQADIVVRYQGGNNAGHTVVTDQGKFVLNLLPSGILHSNVVCILGDGMVVDLEHLENEIAQIRKNGVQVSPSNLKLSTRATISMPWHRVQDELEEDRLAQSGSAFGSTRRGIAYAYSDKYRKKTIRLGDLLQAVTIRNRCLIPHFYPGVRNRHSSLLLIFVIQDIIWNRHCSTAKK